MFLPGCVCHIAPVLKWIIGTERKPGSAMCVEMAPTIVRSADLHERIFADRRKRERERASIVRYRLLKHHNVTPLRVGLGKFFGKYVLKTNLRRGVSSSSSSSEVNLKTCVPVVAPGCVGHVQGLMIRRLTAYGSLPSNRSTDINTRW